MKERKYKEDYGFETYFDNKGREKRRAVYQGDWYHMHAQDARFKFQALISLGLCLCAYLIYMKLNSPSGRCMYVLPLAACALIPLAYWAMGVIAIFRNPEKMTRLQKENGPGRALRSALGCSILLGVASIGDVIFIFSSSTARENGEWLGLGLLFLSTICAIGGFIRCRDAYNRIVREGKRS